MTDHLMREVRSVKRAVAVALALCALLTSCSSMLEREYVVTTDHEENRLRREDFYTVETYQGLLNALDSYIESGLPSGTLRFPTTYRGNLSVDLEKARRQILEEDPLGNYALKNISYSLSKIIAYYEAELTFDYRVDRTTLPEIRRFSTQEALQTALAGTLLEFDEELVCIVGNFAEEETGYFASALRAAYDSVPAAALGMPELEVELYPDSGSRRVAVLKLTYGQTRQSLLRDKTRVELAAARIKEGTEETPEALLALLQSKCVYDPDGGATVFNAILDRRANAEGMALAYALLLQSSGFRAAVEWREDKPLVAVAGGESTEYADPTAGASAAPDF